VRGKNLGVRRSFSGGKGLQVRGKGAYGEDAVAALDNLSAILGVRQADREFVARRVDRDGMGYRHVRLQQQHRGLRVVGGDLIVHFDRENDVYEVNGSYVAGLQLDTAPGIAVSQAVQTAVKDLEGRGHDNVRAAETPELVILAGSGAPLLAYEMKVLGRPVKGQVPGYWRYWINALTGEIVLCYNDVKLIGAPTANGNNTTILGDILSGEGGGGASVTGWYDSTHNAFYLYGKNLKWYIYNASTESSYPDADTYAHRPTGDWDDSDRVEMSGAVGFEATQAYFKNVHGRNSFDNAGVYAHANAHYGTDYVNAFWNSYEQQFSFGDGDGYYSYSLLVMDVIGHEFTHAVTDYTADLMYAYESGALNESFSDIFGACVEFYTQPDGRSSYPNATAGRADWLLAEDCWKRNMAMRDMRAPRNAATVGADGVQPSRYFGENWYAGDGDNGGVHINSGVQNFFFYLLCEGGSGNNDGFIYNITGIGIEHAEQVAYRALTAYCTPFTDYRAVRNAWLSAAADINPAFVATIEAAWLACGIGPVDIMPNAGLVFEGGQGGPFFPYLHTYTLTNYSGSAIDWTLSHTRPWLQVAPMSGTLAAGGSADLSLTLNSGAGGLAKGAYTDDLILRTSAGALLGSREIVVLIGQPDYFSEIFNGYDFDLDGLSLMFTPDSSDSSYSADAVPISALPTDPSAHAAVSLEDDMYFASPILAGGQTVKLYSGSYNRFYIGSNGYITFSSGDWTFVESLAQHFDQPRISACFDDLNPASGGQVKWKQLGDRAVVTFINVPEFGSSNSNTFQVEMFFDGRIRISWLGMAVDDGLAGLSAGNGLPDYFKESDLSGFGWDFDGDTIPNWWEKLYFGNNTNCNPAVDSDGDGQTNLEEFIAGMHPMNPGSCFRIVRQDIVDGAGSGACVLEWDSVEGRVYNVWGMDDLMFGPSLIAEEIHYPVNTYTDTLDQADSCRFYLMDVQLVE
jgi:Zn-dependent metalloprotease